MNEYISHTEVHKTWSFHQLAIFRTLSRTDQLNAIKSNAIEHWTEDARILALDLMFKAGAILPALSEKASLEEHQFVFEPAEEPFRASKVKMRAFDKYLISAAAGWLLIIGSVTAQFYVF